MADQCIVCLEDLETDAPPTLPSADDGPPGNGGQDSTTPTATAEQRPKSNASNKTASKSPKDHIQSQSHGQVARIEICGHMLHDSCLREWSSQANSCPMCRKTFHDVQVYDKVGGTLLSSYKVDDRIQVAEFDASRWAAENLEEDLDEEDHRPCPLCLRADQEEVLLLCDGCEAPYHTHCLGMNRVPRGRWYCMECRPAFVSARRLSVIRPETSENEELEADGPHASRLAPRTRASARLARRDPWQSIWSRISERVYDVLDLDLDFEGDDNGEDSTSWRGYRLTQQQQGRDTQEYRRWQQRLTIASHFGARDVFANNMPSNPRRTIPAHRPPPPPETRDERRAWGALDRAMDAEQPGRESGRKRKSRSSTAEASGSEEPERELKRPRPRAPRPAAQNGQSSTAAARADRSAQNETASSARPTRTGFLAGLLQEIRDGASREEANAQSPVPSFSRYDASSPSATSPTASGHSSPRASSMTPPPRHGRSGSPPLTLSSHIQPNYQAANYSPTIPRAQPPVPRQSVADHRSSPENSDSESRGRRPLVLQAPQPRRGHQASPPRVVTASSLSPDPERKALPPKTTKDGMVAVVKTALRPYWKAGKVNSDQYQTIIHDVYQKLYKTSEGAPESEELKQTWEKMASREVDQAVEALGA